MNAAAKTCILLLDDDPAHLMLAKRAILKGLPDVEINGTSSIQEAQEVITKRTYEIKLAIIDLNLGKESGLDLLKIIRNDSALNHIPIIIISTSTLDSDIAHAYKEKTNCYLFKSDEPRTYQDEILAAVKFFL